MKLDIEDDIYDTLMYIPKNGKIILHCHQSHSENIKNLNISWSRQDSKLMPQKSFTLNNDLVINDVQTEDTGKFVCSAQNIYGESIYSAVIYLIVISK